jgi:hypothetical protein
MKGILGQEKGFWHFAAWIYGAVGNKKQALEKMEGLRANYEGDNLRLVRH